MYILSIVREWAIFDYDKKMFKRHYLTITFGLAALFLIIGFSLYYVHLAGTDNLLIIHFLSHQGADVLGDRGDALGILISGAVIALINIFLASALYTRNRLLAYLISIITVLITLLIFLTMTVIINVN